MPAPKVPNTAAATRTIIRKGQETQARKLREAGWIVIPPEASADGCDCAGTATCTPVESCGRAIARTHTPRLVDTVWCERHPGVHAITVECVWPHLTAGPQVCTGGR